MSDIRAIILDVNGTLYSINQAAGPAFEQLGLDPDQVEPWFESVLMSAFATQMAHQFQPFREFAKHQMDRLLRRKGETSPDATAAVETVMGALKAAEPYPDVGPGVRALADQRLTVSVLTNGTAGIAKAVLTRAGVDEGSMGPLMDINMAAAWKPSADAYQWACEKLRLQPFQVLLVSSHSWDVFAAMREGLHGAFIEREETGPWPGYLHIKPRFTAQSLEQLAQQIKDD